MSNDLKLHPRSSGIHVPPEERGPMMTAEKVARDVWESAVSAKWVIAQMAGEIGFKIGKPWYFYENEARAWKDAWIAKQREQRDAMTPARTSGKRGGNFEIDRVIEGLDKPLRKSLGTPDLKKFRQRVALIEKAEKLEQYELLRAFQNDEISIEEMIEADARGKLREGIDGVKLNANLWDAIEVTLPSMGKTAATRYRYQTSFKALQKKAAKTLGDNARVADLEKLDLKELKAAWGGSGTDWMHLRRAVSAFLSKYLDLYHPFRRRVMKDFPTAKEHKRKPNVSIDQFKKVVRRMRPQLAPCAWSLAISGMRLNEYLRLSRADLKRPYVAVPGTKNEQSEAEIEIDPRFWHYISDAVPCPVGEEYLRKQWNAAVKLAGMKNIHLHDLRHCHAQWAIDAGVAESKVQASLRHKSPGQTRDYTLRNATGEVSAALADALLPPTKKEKRA
jgi:integrase